MSFKLCFLPAVLRKKTWWPMLSHEHWSLFFTSSVEAEDTMTYVSSQALSSVPQTAVSRKKTPWPMFSYGQWVLLFTSSLEEEDTMTYVSSQALSSVPQTAVLRKKTPWPMFSHKQSWGRRHNDLVIMRMFVNWCRVKKVINGRDWHCMTSRHRCGEWAGLWQGIYLQSQMPAMM